MRRPTTRGNDRPAPECRTIAASHPAIRIRRRAEDSAALRVLTRICPSGCFRFAEDGRVEVSAEGCRDCGICRTVCRATGEIEWSFLPAGLGALVGFG